MNQACSGPYWDNIGPWSFLYGPRSDILPLRPSCLVNKIYVRMFRFITFCQNAMYLTRLDCATFYQSVLRHEQHQDVIAELRRPEGPPSGAPYSYRKEKEAHELIFSWLSRPAALLVGVYARRRRRRRRRSRPSRPL